MPPKNAAAANSARRNGPQFKPPRPVNAPTQASATAQRAPATKKTTASGARPAFQRATEIVSSEDEQEEDAEDEDIDDDDLMEIDAPTRDTRTAQPASSMSNPIPAALLARLLYENFEDSNTQIQKGAMNLVGKYMEIFVREAFARAKNEREMGLRAGGISDGFLQVEDLEKLAPQLVLDF
ncbi:hypothetical protein EK21DRAFT_90282 [Setomelanomma holmii]|uniref:CENP-S n=1 Tax=Setomelanomma holmii TaxID=210430 RepID=A0A9P4LL68_9PLEO|nr:hypothetical protein EK21DRAFT_90282 [Setomelanomma holmii]